MNTLAQDLDFWFKDFRQSFLIILNKYYAIFEPSYSYDEVLKAGNICLDSLYSAYKTGEEETVKRALQQLKQVSEFKNLEELLNPGMTQGEQQNAEII